MAPAKNISNLKTSTTQLIQDPEKKSFPDLPLELRDHIYNYVLADHEISLPSSRTKKELVTSSIIPGLKKQVRNEFLTRAWLAGNIPTTVTDFEFQYVSPRMTRVVHRTDAQNLHADIQSPSSTA
jgi:hypothetical protein